MKLFLSRLVLDPANRRARHDLSDTYQMHRTISRAFVSPDLPSVEAKELLGEARFLFRIDEDPRGRCLTSLVQSRTEPDWSQVDASDGYLIGSPEVKEFSAAFGAGQRLAFHLRANPTVKRAGKRFGLYREDEQAKWMRRKAEQGGFSPEILTTRIEERISHSKGKGGGVEFLAVRFSGTLRVLNPDLLMASVANGIGSAKGFGFGLLSLARPI